MQDVNVIRPNGSLDAALEQHRLAVDRETVRVLGFPKHLFEFGIEIDRKMLVNRETAMSVTVDLLTGTCRKNDIYPEVQPRSVSSTSLLNPRLGVDTAAETAYSFVRRQINRRYQSFTTPDIQTARDETVFKLFWIVPASPPGKVDVIDTITHQLTAQDVTLDEFTEKSATEPLDR